MILKRKLFNQVSSAPTNFQTAPKSNSLLVENLKLQRQLSIDRRVDNRIKAQERISQNKQLVEAQKSEQRKEQDVKRNQLEVKKLEDSENKNLNKSSWSMVNSRTKPVQPVSMK